MSCSWTCAWPISVASRQRGASLLTKRRRQCRSSPCRQAPGARFASPHARRAVSTFCPSRSRPRCSLRSCSATRARASSPRQRTSTRRRRLLVRSARMTVRALPAAARGGRNRQRRGSGCHYGRTAKGGDAHGALGRRVAALTAAFDYDALLRLAESLDEPAPSPRRSGRYRCGRRRCSVQLYGTSRTEMRHVDHISHGSGDTRRPHRCHAPQARPFSWSTTAP